MEPGFRGYIQRSPPRFREIVKTFSSWPMGLNVAPRGEGGEPLVQPFFQRDGVTIYNGDCRNVLRSLPPGSIHTVVTSPPYWGLRDYGVAGQLGLEHVPDCLGWATRNKRSVWTIPTRSYSGAHFAVFPPDLIRPCLLAGTSAEGCCAECGTPHRRVIEKKRIATRSQHEDYRTIREDDRQSRSQAACDINCAPRGGSRDAAASKTNRWSRASCSIRFWAAAEQRPWPSSWAAG